MEITNEIKAKVFAQYLGQPVKYIPDPEGRFITSNQPPMKEWGLSMFYEGIYWLVNGENKFTLQNRFLILKPLSSITDEDVIEVAKVIGYGDNFSLDYRLRVVKKNIDNALIPLKGYQFLQSKGYDLPQYLLGGKTLKEVGLAIYKEDLK